jgi:hypothetical protein
MCPEVIIVSGIYRILMNVEYFKMFGTNITKLLVRFIHAMNILLILWRMAAP